MQALSVTAFRLIYTTHTVYFHLTPQILEVRLKLLDAIKKSGIVRLPFRGKYTLGISDEDNQYG